MTAPSDSEPPAPAPGESLAERVRRDGPLSAGPAWTVACQLLDALASLHARGVAHGSLDPSKIHFPGAELDQPITLADGDGLPVADPVGGSDATRDDVRQLGTALWFALTGEPPESPLPWLRLERAGITPELGGLPVLLARTLTGEPAQRPPTVPALLETLKRLASFGAGVSGLPPMPSRAPASDPAAPSLQTRPPFQEEGELWTRPTAPLSPPNHRRQPSRRMGVSLLLFALGVAVGFVGGVCYEKNRPVDLSWWPHPFPQKTSGPPPEVASATAAPEPDVPLPPSPPVSAGAAAVRLARIKSVQPDTGDVLKYARELRRVATLPVGDAAGFPGEAMVARLLERFDWRDPASPYFHRTPLLLVLGYSSVGSDAQRRDASQHGADAVAQALSASGITSPIYPCPLGSADETPEVEQAAAKSGQFVEVWVAWTLF